MNTDGKNSSSVFICLNLWLILVFGFSLNSLAADADYKHVVITTGTDFVRVRLPLTDVTGKVRVKEKSLDGFGIPVAPSKTILDKHFYLEWQIGYDTPDANDASVVPKIEFTRKGETKYGHELSKIIFEAVRLGILSTNDLMQEIHKLEKIPASEFEESRAVRVETSTNLSNGFQSAVERLPQFTKTTSHGSVQIQLKQKQRAVGYQAMVYVCLPMTEVLALDGNPRVAAKAKAKETVFYDFNSANRDLILAIVDAFGLASRQHNEDIRQIFENILQLNAP
jgi:R.Pab1 restriction endonuclease